MHFLIMKRVFLKYFKGNRRSMLNSSGVVKMKSVPKSFNRLLNLARGMDVTELLFGDVPKVALFGLMTTKRYSAHHLGHR